MSVLLTVRLRWVVAGCSHAWAESRGPLTDAEILRVPSLKQLSISNGVARNLFWRCIPDARMAEIQARRQKTWRDPWR